MADIRIKDLPTTATQTASDDFIALDGTVNGTRKIDASAPSFKTSVTSPSVVAPAATNLTLTGGSTGASLVLGQGANGAVTITPKGTGKITGIVQNASSVEFTDAAAATFRLTPSGSAGAGLITIGTSSLNTPLAFAVNDSGIISEGMRLSKGNLLIGGTTDITGSGGLKVFGTTAASSTGTGAVVIGNGTAGGLGVGGSIRAGSQIVSGYATVGGQTPGGAFTASSTDPRLFLNNTSAAADTGSWNFRSDSSGTLQISTGNDAVTAGTVALAFTRSTGTPTNANFNITTSASSSTVGALTVGNGTAATNVAIGGGNVNAGGGLTLGSNIEMSAATNIRFNGGTGLIYTGGYSYALSLQSSQLNLNTLSNSPITTGTGLATFGGAATFAGNVTVTGGQVIGPAGTTGLQVYPSSLTGFGALYGDANATTGVTSYGSSHATKASKLEITAPAGTTLVGTGNNLTVSATTPSTGVGTGALQVAGGIYAGAASVLNGFTSFNGGASIQGSTAAYRYLMFATGATNNGANAGRRYNVGVSTTAESGSNVGSDYEIRAYDDAGSPLRGGPDLLMTRSTGAATFAGAVLNSDGTAAAPSLSFSADTDTGFYRQNTNVIGVSLAGAAAGRFEGDGASGIRFRHPTGNYLGLNNSGAIEVIAAGTNQNITLTPSGTGILTTAARATVTNTTAGSAGAGALVVSGGLATGAASYFGGKVNLLTHTTSAGGIGFGTDVTLHRLDANTLQVQPTGTSKPVLLYGDATNSGVFNALASFEAVYFDPTAHSLILATNGTTKVTIASTGAATFTGTISPQQATTGGAPAYVKGAIYFDTTLNKLRVGGATGWETITSV